MSSLLKILTCTIFFALLQPAAHAQNALTTQEADLSGRDSIAGSTPSGNGDTGFTGQTEFLPVEQAYQLQATVNGNRLQLHWLIASIHR